MRCPFCSCHETQVKDSRPSEDNTAIRRRRICSDCGGRFTTFERIQLREMTVVKKSGRKMPFKRDKLERSVRIALRKRAVDEERIVRMISGIVRQLEASGEAEVHIKEIGALAMEGLKRLDDVAYIRFASVYQDFTETADFQTVLRELAKAGEKEE